MSPGEAVLRLTRKLYQMQDRSWQPNWDRVRLETFTVFPRLPRRELAPAVLLQALGDDSARIRRGEWLAFGHLPLRVDDPPQWDRDYAAGVTVANDRCAFSLNHRALPQGADIKLIWELSRWHPLVRLGQAAWLLGDTEAGQTVLRWLGHWVEHNRPYHGWNWTSALESGMRLIQFTWIDALLSQSGGAYEAALAELRPRLLPAHVRFTWRYRSVGSSANNHLLGELAGLILATVRWPALCRWGASLDQLQAEWEREVLAQFARDGGNREQALNYQLFSWELSWQIFTALVAAGRQVSTEVQDRLKEAIRFFTEAQVPADPWDYGDSDNATATPFALQESAAMQEWHRWASGTKESPALEFWWPHRPKARATVSARADEHDFEQSGIIIRRTPDGWTLRWDVSPLGYLVPAAHGHLDALHLSLWFQDVAMIVDPGTGAYYADSELRNYLASRAAHNGPAPNGQDFPKRLGPFLWSHHHDKPTFCRGPGGSMAAEARLPEGTLRRVITPVRGGWQVDDSYTTHRGSAPFAVHWQLPPASILEPLGGGHFRVQRRGVRLAISLEGDRSMVEAVNVQEKAEGLAGTVSPSFRRRVWAPYLRVQARGGEKPCVLRTTFLASDAS